MTPEQLNQLAQALVDVAVRILLVVGPFLGAWLTLKVREFLKNQQVVSDQQIVALSRVAVMAAEQLGLTHKIADKKQFAVDWLEDALLRRGLKVPVGEIEAAVEAAVMSEFNKPPIISVEQIHSPA